MTLSKSEISVLIMGIAMSGIEIPSDRMIA